MFPKILPTIKGLYPTIVLFGNRTSNLVMIYPDINVRKVAIIAESQLFCSAYLIMVDGK